jgi:two-component system NtrC family sensor kinase
MAAEDPQPQPAPSGEDNLREALARARERVRELELALMQKDGIPLLTAPVQLHDALAPLVTARSAACDAAAERQAAAERDRFFTMSADMLTVAGLDGFFKRVNPAFERTLGYTSAELTTHPWLDFVHPDDRDATVAEGSKLSEGALTLNFDNRYRCKNGSFKWLSWSAVPVVAEGLIYAVARDITERKHFEERLQEKNRLLEQAAESERTAHATLRLAQRRLVESEKLAALGQLVAGVAHEINNPLAFVTNNLAVLQRDLGYVRELIRLYQSGDRVLADADPALLGQIRELANSIDLPYTLSELDELLPVSREGLSRIRQIVKDLREFARHDAMGDVQEGADLNAGIESTVNIARGRAHSQHVKLELDLAPLPPVTCQPAKINQVVLNLVVNAMDACGEAGGTVTVRTRPSRDGVEIQVADTGSGIPPGIRDRIFDPFFTTKPQGRGTGMGLSISHGIVAEHGGRIEVDSTPGRGSTFSVYLPLTPPRLRMAGAGRESRNGVVG